eukprot:SAG31_NODE_11515_length_1022_cov_0.944745_1_plen_79_part_10
MSVLHLCHAVTGDSKGPAGHWSMSERLVTAASNKRFQLLGIGGVPVSSAQWFHFGVRASTFYGVMASPVTPWPNVLTAE